MQDMRIVDKHQSLNTEIFITTSINNELLNIVSRKHRHLLPHLFIGNPAYHHHLDV